MKILIPGLLALMTASGVQAETAIPSSQVNENINSTSESSPKKNESMRTTVNANIKTEVADKSRDSAQDKTSRPFLWGAASAAYQVEGAINEDGRGRSVWDYYLDDKQMAGPGVSGAVAVNFYDRKQYLNDIKLLKAMGLNSYRFSIAWPRIIPDGNGPVNLLAVQHYKTFIQDLKLAGIKPIVTLYHWDMPLALAKAGGWQNKQSVEWFAHYAQVVFKHFAGQVDDFILVNEPTSDLALTIKAQQLLKDPTDSTPAPFVVTPAALGQMLNGYNNLLLATAKARQIWDSNHYQGRMGLSLALSPVLTGAEATANDRNDAKIVDGVLNRWALDAMYKGTYPSDVLQLTKQLNVILNFNPDDAKLIKAAHFDFLGVNYYAPVYIRHKLGSADGFNPESYIPEGQKVAYNGPVRPDQFTALLQRIQKDYGNPKVIITENGASFPGNDDQLVNGKVIDTQRCEYIIDHIAAMQKAKAGGANIEGYMLWSSHDNLEWFSGYKPRFGLIYVDRDTQQRIPKQSSIIYQRIIKGETVDHNQCLGK